LVEGRFEAARQHVIDINEVTLSADAASKEIDGCLEISITGTGRRTLVAIQRMVPAWASTKNDRQRWSTKAASFCGLRTNPVCHQ
jgi:hypothetical protein